MIVAFALSPGSIINHNPFHQFPDVLHFPLKVSHLKTNALATLVAYIDPLLILAIFRISEDCQGQYASSKLPQLRLLSEFPLYEVLPTD